MDAKELNAALDLSLDPKQETGSAGPWKTSTILCCLGSRNFQVWRGNAFKALLAGAYQVTIVTLLMFFVCCFLATAKTSTVVTIFNDGLLVSSNHSNFSNFSGGNQPDPQPLWTLLLQIAGSFLYTINGMLNLRWLALGVKKSQLTPHMAYINAFMCWSAVIFGPLQILTDVVAPALGYEWTLRFDYWYTLPNFGFAVEWAWQLIESKKELGKTSPRNGQKNKTDSKPKIRDFTLGPRGLIIMLLSIASIAADCRYLGGLVFPIFGVECAAGSRHPGYDVAFVSQALAAVLMAVYCLIRYRSARAILSFGLFFVGFIGFVALQDLHHHVSPAIAETHWFESVKEIGIKLCDNTQINFSIWFFVYMFRKQKPEQSICISNCKMS